MIAVSKYFIWLSVICFCIKEEFDVITRVFFLCVVEKSRKAMLFVQDSTSMLLAFAVSARRL